MFWEGGKKKKERAVQSYRWDLVSYLPFVFLCLCCFVLFCFVWSKRNYYAVSIHQYRGARIQVLDLPGIIEGAADGRGRGRQVISTARTCNLILVVLDAAKPVTHKKIIEQELFNFGIRINQKTPPDVKFVKKESGGIGYQEMVKQTKGMNADVARLVCKEYRVSCAEIILREDITVSRQEFCVSVCL